MRTKRANRFTGELEEVAVYRLSLSDEAMGPCTLYDRVQSLWKHTDIEIEDSKENGYVIVSMPVADVEKLDADLVVEEMRDAEPLGRFRHWSWPDWF